MTGIDFDDTGASLDPTDWAAFRAQAHRMLDDILDFTRDTRQRPVWTPAPQHVRDGFRTSLPQAPADLGSVHDAFMRDILPYTAGNTHPGFMGWVQGGGTPVGTLAEMLAAGLNANLGGRDQIPLEVEKQVLQWMRELFAFPATAWPRRSRASSPTRRRARTTASRRRWTCPASARPRCGWCR